MERRTASIALRATAPPCNTLKALENVPRSAGLRTFGSKTRFHNRSTCNIAPYYYTKKGPNLLYAVSVGVRSACNPDGGIVLDIDHGQVFRLNPVGALILELLMKGSAEAEMVHEIAQRYGIDEGAARADVREFLVSLEQSKLIHKKQEEAS
jgi:hypothetical protein